MAQDDPLRSEYSLPNLIKSGFMGGEEPEERKFRTFDEKKGGD